MTNLVKTLNNYLKQNIPNLKIENDLFSSSDTEGVISVHDPATKTTQEYIDGTSESQINISYTARFKNALTSREILTNILNLLDGLKLVDNQDGLRLKIKAVANVQFIGTDEKNNSFYTSSVNVTYNSL